MHDFSTFTSRTLLARQGIFSPGVTDRPIDVRELEIAHAYQAIGEDRKAVYRSIAARLEGTRFDGVWARSTLEYAVERNRHDELVLEIAKQHAPVWYDILDRKTDKVVEVILAARHVHIRLAQLNGPLGYGSPRYDAWTRRYRKAAA